MFHFGYKIRKQQANKPKLTITFVTADYNKKIEGYEKKILEAKEQNQERVKLQKKVNRLLKKHKRLRKYF